MKKLLLLVLLLAPALSHAQAGSPFYRNDSNAALAGGAGDKQRSVATVNFLGQQFPMFPSPYYQNVGNDTAETGSTTQIIKATTHAMVVNDILQFGTTSSARSGLALVTEVIDANNVRISPPLRTTPSNGDFFFIMRPALVGVDANNNATFSPRSSIGAEIFPLQSNYWQSCSSSNTGTTDIAIKAAVASNRIYTTSISCFNTAAVASAIAFKDGSTQIYVGAVGNSTLQGVAHYEASLPIPLRGTVNTALNFAMGTNATATTCCAVGYISTN